jgi:RNA polymerase sigma-70 factor, ECF subfamily
MQQLRTAMTGFQAPPMSTATPERMLVARCKAGDDAAFTELIRRSSPIALRAIRTIAHNAADIEDVMQDTVVNAFNKLSSFDQRSKFSTWLTRIALNNALLLLRRRRNKIEISLDSDGDESDCKHFQLADNRIGPEQALVRQQSIGIVRNAVHSLPSSLREYVEQRYLEELPHREAASSLGISLAAGKSRSLRARRRLLSLLASRRGGSTVTAAHPKRQRSGKRNHFKHPSISRTCT